MDLKKLNLLENKKGLVVLNTVLLLTLAGSTTLDQIYISKIRRAMGMDNNGNFLSSLQYNLLKTFAANAKLSGNLTEDAAKLAFTQGMPEVYGGELSVNFDDVQNSMNIMKEFDPTYGGAKIILTGDELKRYISVASKIACEYCCGASSLIDAKGNAACGCAHSQAMRGLAAYLIQKHGGQFTDDQILRELARWKGRYFPKQMMQKAADQLKSGQYTPDIAALLLDLKIPKYSADSKDAPTPSNIQNAPNMVGGC